jgi:hypothetical protein
MGARDRKQFATALERWRAALIASDIGRHELGVALTMLGQANYAPRYIASGRLISWLGEETIATATGTSPATVRRCRTVLKAAGIVIVDARTARGGRGLAAEYQFRDEWREAIEAQIERRSVAAKERASKESAEIEAEPMLPLGVAPGKPPRKYVFEAGVIRLTEEHFAQWQRNYSNIPDLRGSLQTIADKLACGQLEIRPTKAGKPGNWYTAVSAWLNFENGKRASNGSGAHRPSSRGGGRRGGLRDAALKNVLEQANHGAGSNDEG